MDIEKSNQAAIASGNLIPPPGIATGPTRGTSHAQRIAMWFDLVEATDAIQVALLRARHPSEAEAMAAYRECYARYTAEHDQTVRHLISQLNRRCRNHGG